jgi:pyruvate kinase
VRQTRIIATIGPASDSDDVIRALVRADVDVFRLNFSHGTHESHGAAIDRIRRAAAAAGSPVAIMQDLSGPKIRTGRLAGGRPLQLTVGAGLVIEIGDFVGEPGRIATTAAELPKAVKPGDVLLLDDGRIQLTVRATTDRAIETNGYGWRRAG